MAGIVLGGACVARADTLHVSLLGNDGNDGLSWSAPMRTILAAVAAARDNGHALLLVSNGTYNVSAAITVNTALRVEAFDPDVTQTVVRRTSGSNPIFQIEHADAVVHGFTIENGNVTGGGARMTAGTLSACIVKDGTTGQYGAGVWLNGGGLVTNCTIRNNKFSLGTGGAVGGGGVYMTGGLLVDSLIEGNQVISSATLGGGVYAAGGLIDRCVITGNYAHSSGAGVYLTSGAQMRNSLVRQNRSRLETGGVYVHNGRVESCTIVGNIAAGNNGGVNLTANGTLLNSIVVDNVGASPGALRNLSNNGGAVTNSCVQPAPAGVGNTAADPLFADADGGDFRPLTGSPVIDQGSDQGWMSAAFDLDFNPRLAGTVDMGAFEALASNAGPLRAGFTVDVRRGTAPWQAVFTASVAGANQAGLHYYWDFGNGTTNGAGLGLVTNAYNAVGIYTVTLTVSNSALEGVTVVKDRHIVSGPLDWYVSPEGSSTPPYNSWDTALTDIHWACARAGSNDTIYLAGRDFPLDRTLTFTSAHVTVKGGYAATGGAGPGARDSHRHPTRLTRDPTVEALRVMTAENASACVFEDLTITGGRSFSGFAGVPGGGLAVLNSANLSYIRCRLLDNTAVNSGGGLYSLNSTASFTGGEVSLNRVYATWWSSTLRGGGAYLEGASGAWTFRDTVFGGNNTDMLRIGAGIWDTREKLHGGGLYVHSGTHEIANCALYGNNGDATRYHNEATPPSFAYTMEYQGCGLYVANGTVSVRNSTILGNKSEGVRRANGTVSLTDCIVWDNGANVTGTVTVAYCNVQTGEFAGSNNNISEDPRFVRGLYLHPDSSSRNKGSDDASVFGLDTFTTQTNGVADGGTVDLGYHYANGLLPAYADLYVAEGGNDTNGGATPGDALRTVTRALALARDGTHIHVGTGLYNPAAGETFPLVMARPGLHLVGAGRDATSLDANKTDQVVTIKAIPVDGRLADLTVSGGYFGAVGYTRHTFGAGIGIWLSQIRLDGLRVTGNELKRMSVNKLWGTGYGGGIGGCFAKVTLEDSLVVTNTANSNSWTGGDFGGGIGVLGGEWTVRRSVVAFNKVAGAYRAINYGGGLFVDGGSHLFENLLIYSNVSNKVGTDLTVYVGDGVYILNEANAVFRNCTLAHNEGQGLHSFVGAGMPVTIDSCILWGNAVNIPGVAVYAIGATGAVAVAWSDSQNVHAGTGNLVVDPLFAGNGDYHLRSKTGRWTPTGWVRDKAHSPCIDAGPRGAPVGLEPEPNGGRVNLGAYGGTAQASLYLANGALILIR
jgi:PKD repeat protein